MVKIAPKGQSSLDTFVGHRFIGVVAALGNGKSFTMPGIDAQWRIR